MSGEPISHVPSGLWSAVEPHLRPGDRVTTAVVIAEVHPATSAAGASDEADRRDIVVIADEDANPAEVSGTVIEAASRMRRGTLTFQRHRSDIVDL